MQLTSEGHESSLHDLLFPETESQKRDESEDRYVNSDKHQYWLGNLGPIKDHSGFLRSIGGLDADVNRVAQLEQSGMGNKEKENEFLEEDNRILQEADRIQNMLSKHFPILSSPDRHSGGARSYSKILIGETIRNSNLLLRT
jgi:hypothetical protein